MFASNTSQVANDAVFIEDTFACHLYTGNNSTQTITNGIDLSTKGGLVWIKGRNSTTIVPTFNHKLFDTERGIQRSLESNSTNAEQVISTSLTAFTNSGFTLGGASQTNLAFGSDIGQYASWTFRKQPKFFDVVTYTGTGSNTTISHSLGSVPACIMVKRTDTTGAWQVYHRSLANTEYLVLNTTAAKATGTTRWNSTTPTSTVFSIGTDATVNASGGTYVAYLFAHNAGGFGLTGTDNVISCGSYTGNGSTTGPVVDLGYEPQWLLVKRSSASGDDWILVDNMRGFPVTGNTQYLNPNNSFSESNFALVSPLATGFQPRTTDGGYNANGSTYIYIAIRRGPMKVPTSGTSVFTPQTRTGTGSAASITGVGFPVDLVIDKPRTADTGSFEDRLRGSTQNLVPSSTGAESTSSSTWDVTSFASMDGIDVGISGNVNINTSGTATVNWFFRRAPSFFDEVCYTGTDAVRTINHNLGVAPELIIVKGRNTNPANSSYWTVYTQPTGNTNYMYLDSLNATSAFSGYWNNTSPTASVFTLGTGNGEDTNATGKNYVAYLFATCAGVSKVGSYTGNGSTQTINCGFTGGARFVLIKRTDDAGDWYVYDTARGMTTLTDPYLRLNTTTAEFATLGSVTTVSTGFAVNASILAAINTNGASYIFLAIA